MVKLTAKKRDALPNAKASATQPVKKGNLSPAEKSRIVAKANRLLHGS